MLTQDMIRTFLYIDSQLNITIFLLINYNQKLINISSDQKIK